MGNSVYNGLDNGYGASTNLDAFSGYSSVISSGTSTISFKVGENYPNISCKTIDGDSFTLNYLKDINLGNINDGIYTIYVDDKGNTSLIQGNTYIQPDTPIDPINSLWINTSKYPYEIKSYSNGIWNNYNKEPFTFVGNINVNSEGTANNFSKTNYISVDMPDTRKSNYSIECTFQYKVGIGQNVIFGNHIITDNKFRLSLITNGNKLMLFASSGTDSWDIALNAYGKTTLLDGNKYKVIFSRIGGTLYQVKLKNLLTNIETIEIEIDSTEDIFYHPSIPIYIGSTLFAWTPFAGEIYLNNFTITEDNFTLISGSFKNIVPLGIVKIYNHTVELYQTLPYNNKEVTKPNNVKPSTLIENFIGNNYFYRIYSDGWCEQGGTIGVTTSGETIVFYKTMIDTNYTISISSSSSYVSYSNKLTDSIVVNPLSNGSIDWVIRGYCI